MQINKIYHKIFASAMLILLMASCEKEIKFNGDIVQPMMVVNGLITPDSTIRIHLSKSRFFLSNNEKTEDIPNAAIDIYINGQAKGKMQCKESGIYTSSIRPSINDTVKLVIADTDIQGVQSEVVIPRQSILQSVDTATQTIRNEIYEFDGYNMVPTGRYSYMKELTVKLTIKDPPAIENFYRLNIKMRTQMHYPDTTYTWEGGGEIHYADTTVVWEEYEYFYLEGTETPNESLLGFIDIINSSAYSYTITDEFFDGKDKTLKFKFLYTSPKIGDSTGSEEDDENYYPTTFRTPDSQSKQLTVNLQSISKEMYLYFKTKENADNVFDTFFTEPVQIYSNIKNGMGVLGAYTNHEIKIELP